MLEKLAIAAMYLAASLVYGIICHFAARSRRLRVSCLGGFMWPFTDYIYRVDGNNNFARKNSGKDFIRMMVIWGGIKLARDIIIFVGRVILLIVVAFLTAFLIFWDWVTRRRKFEEEIEINMMKL